MVELDDSLNKVLKFEFKRVDKELTDFEKVLEKLDTTLVEANLLHFNALGI